MDDCQEAHGKARASEDSSLDGEEYAERQEGAGQRHHCPHDSEVQTLGSGIYHESSTQYRFGRIAG